MADYYNEKNWYVVHTYSGYENKVKTNLEKRIKSMGMEDKIFRVVVPTEIEVEVKDGKHKEKEKKTFPGYVLVEMLMTDDSWYVVRNTPGVSGFIGSYGKGSKPTPMHPWEVDEILERIENAEVGIAIDFGIGDTVRIIEGAFEDHIGEVIGIDKETMKVTVEVLMLGRQTEVELSISHVERA